MTIESTEQQVMTEREASQLTEKIRITAHNYADARQKLAQYVEHVMNPEDCTHHASVQRRIHHRSKGPVRLDPDVREVVDVVGTY